MSVGGTRRMRFALVGALTATLVGLSSISGDLHGAHSAATVQPSPTQAAEGAALSIEQQEAFLKKAKVIRARAAGKGVTGSLRATLSDGVVTHDVSIQTVDEAHREFRSKRGTELNFVDSWRYNVAAYKLDRLLGFNMTPPSVQRNHNGKVGAFTWWVDEVLMDEGERLAQKANAPNPGVWNEQMWHVRLFDQLIANTDRNLGNLLIDKRWTVWMIDHTRAFRLSDEVRSPESLTKCDREIYTRLKALDLASIKAAVGTSLTGNEMKTLLQRRDAIVGLLDKRGTDALFDWQRQGS